MKLIINKMYLFWRDLSKLTRYLCIFTLINIVVINLILIPILSYNQDPIIYQDRIIYLVKDFLLFRHQNDDSWDAMSKAFNYIRHEHQTPLYQEIFFKQKIKFQYPPTSLLIFSLLESIDSFLKAINISWFGVLKGLSYLFMVVMVYFVIKIFNLSLIRNFTQKQNNASKADLIIRNVIICCLVLTFYPIIKAYNLGQIQTWINSMFAILFWSWMKGKKGIAGIICAILCLLKPQYLIIFIWGILRKELNFVMSFITTISIGILISIQIFGVADNIDYLNVLSFIPKHGEAFYPNQSINGTLNRLFHNGDIFIFHSHSFPPFNIYVYVGTLISSIALISVALFPPKREIEKGNVIDLAIISLTCTIASPIAWEHHYGILAPIYAYLIPLTLRINIFGNIKIPYLAISYLLASNFLGFTNRLAYTKLNLNIIQSYLLVAALMILVFLYILRGRLKMFDGSKESTSTLIYSR